MIYQSPYAPILIEADELGITTLTFDLSRELPSQSTNPKSLRHLKEATKQLDDYFLGKRRTFDLPLHYTTGTVFQQKVWSALLQIPYGQTRSYLDIATAIAAPKAVRAIGQANKANPIAVLIPCHRVIGKNGQLTGYMGAGESGLLLKKNLLKLEGIMLPV